MELIEFSEELVRVYTVKEVVDVHLVKETVLVEIFISISECLLFLSINELLEGANLLGSICGHTITMDA